MDSIAMGSIFNDPDGPFDYIDPAVLSYNYTDKAGSNSAIQHPLFSDSTETQTQRMAQPNNTSDPQHSNDSNVMDVTADNQLYALLSSFIDEHSMPNDSRNNMPLNNTPLRGKSNEELMEEYYSIQLLTETTVLLEKVKEVIPLVESRFRLGIDEDMIDQLCSKVSTLLLTSSLSPLETHLPTPPSSVPSPPTQSFSKLSPITASPPQSSSSSSGGKRKWNTPTDTFPIMHDKLSMPSNFQESPDARARFKINHDGSRSCLKNYSKRQKVSSS